MADTPILQGELARIQLPDVLTFISMIRGTGKLTLHGATKEITIDLSARRAAMTAAAGTWPLRAGGTTVTACPRRPSSATGSSTEGCSRPVVTM